MLGILPDPHPGELAYGVVARYVRAFTDTRRVSAVSTGWLGVTHASQYGLSGAERIVGRNYQDPVAVRHRLWADASICVYGCATFPEHRRIAARDMLCGETRVNPEVAAEALIVPIMGRKSAPGLRWCDACAEEDLHGVGEAYWHRQHQLPGTAVCLRHRRWLHATMDVVRQAVFVGPDEVGGLDSRVLGRGTIPTLLRRSALLDEQILQNACSIDLPQLRDMLLYELLLRAPTARSLGYNVGWESINLNEHEQNRLVWWDAGLTSFGIMKRDRVVRSVFRMNQQDIVATKIAPLLVLFGRTLADTTKCDWQKELCALKSSRGIAVKPRPTVADYLARRREVQRLWRANHPELVAAANRRYQEAVKKDDRLDLPTYEEKAALSWAKREAQTLRNPELKRASNRRYRLRWKEKNRESSCAAPL
jgi:hypothetical protein